MLSKPLMTVHDVAELLQVKEATVRSWINDQSLRAVKFGKEWRVAVKDLEAFVECHANRPADGPYGKVKTNGASQAERQDRGAAG